jgi:hypothetical protein
VLRFALELLPGPVVGLLLGSTLCAPVSVPLWWLLLQRLP